MKNYCVLKINKIHSMASLGTVHMHNFRDLPLKHVDINESVRNEELINDSGMDYNELWHRRIKEIELATGSPVAIRKNGVNKSVLAYEIMTTFSHEAIHSIDLNAWKEANVRWLKETFGSENVLSAQLHMDEMTPHIHAIVIPIDERKHLCAKSFTGGKGKLRALQTSYGRAMAAVGLCRGEMFTRARNKSLKRYYTDLEKAVNSAAPKRQPNEQLEAYLSRVDEYIQNMNLYCLKMKNNYERKISIEQSKGVQALAHYKEAIRLQQDIEEIFKGDMTAVTDRLICYRKIERAVPRNILSEFLEKILLRFPMTENISLKSGKKKTTEEKTSADDALFR